MAQIEKPRTQKEQTDQLWMIIIGSNGEGLAEQVKETRKDVHELKTSMQRFYDTRFSTCPTVQWLQEKEEEEKKEKKDKIDKRLVVYGLVVGAVAAAPSWLQWLGEVVG
jgi:hypothetical protein